MATLTLQVPSGNPSEVRRLLPGRHPESFHWSTRVTLRAGRSAGVLFGASADGTRGYVARLDSRLGMLILEQLGPWPEETRLATFPWEPIDGANATFEIVAGNGAARVWVKARGREPLLETLRYKPFGDCYGSYTLDADARFQNGVPEPFDAPKIVAHSPVVGKFTHLYDQGIGEKEPWYINDHCIVRGDDGWHLFGITHKQPADPMHERDFAHATSPMLTQAPWAKQPFALTWDPSVGENHLWAPHVIRKGNTYYMFYCAGSLESNYSYRIHLATSTDLRHWVRYKGNPLFQDFYDARDPMVLRVGETYYLYYTANLDKERNHHVVNVRTSRDLLHWSPARVALIHPETGTFGGPTESPFVVHYGDHFYLFCGPDGGYHATKVYRSCNPYAWNAEPIASFPSHAAEVVQDLDGKYYATDAGWDLNGVYLAPIEWKPSDR